MKVLETAEKLEDDEIVDAKRTLAAVLKIALVDNEDEHVRTYMTAEPRLFGVGGLSDLSGK